MGWRDLLQAKDEHIVLPWVGGRSLRTYNRTWSLQGRLPPEYGWHKFQLTGRKARWAELTDPQVDVLRDFVEGYLVGDRFVPDHIGVLDRDLEKLSQLTEQVHLIDPGLDRFARIKAGRPCEEGPLVFEGLTFPLGPEDAVLEAFLDRKDSVADVLGVTPSLDAAFRWETWQRAEAERRRREEEERRAKEERRQKIVESLGDGALRREVAIEDFEAAARAALAVGNAELLDFRKAHAKDEMVVRFRVERRRFECTCNAKTLRIIDAGICLIDHGDNERRYDDQLTLESLPGVIREAQNIGRLVVFRRID